LDSSPRSSRTLASQQFPVVNDSAPVQVTQGEKCETTSAASTAKPLTFTLAEEVYYFTIQNYLDDCWYWDWMLMLRKFCSLVVISILDVDASS